MKYKRAICLLAMVALLLMSGCAQKDPSVKRTIEGLRTYHEMQDGTWMCNDHSYKYRMEFSGIMGGKTKAQTLVYLSNLDFISIYKVCSDASMISSDLKDYFSIEEAVLVEWDLQ